MRTLIAILLTTQMAFANDWIQMTEGGECAMQGKTSTRGENETYIWMLVEYRLCDFEFGDKGFYPQAIGSMYIRNAFVSKDDCNRGYGVMQIAKGDDWEHANQVPFAIGGNGRASQAATVLCGKSVP